MSILRRLLNLGRPEHLSRDIEREISFHLRERVEELRALGVPEAEAILEARKQFGNPTFQRERTRDADVIAWLDSLLGDVRYGVRALGRSPAFTVVAVASLALAIGANTAIYTLIDAVVLRSLPVPGPEQLAQVTQGEPKGGEYFTNPLWEQIRDRQSGFTQLAAFSETSFISGEGADAKRLNGEWVSGDYFALFGMQPLLGRLPGRADDKRGCPGTAILAHGYWQRAFGGRAAAVGSTIAIEGKPLEIVGVTRPGFDGPEVGREPEVYVPICAEAVIRGRHSALDRRSNWWLRIMGRRDATVRIEEVSARLKTIAPAVYEATLPPNWSAKSKADYLKSTLAAFPAESGVSEVRTRYTRALVVMMGAVGLVLLIACANVANLLLARAAARQREVAIRLAIGAARRRLVRQLLTESALLAVAGAALGLVVAHWGTRALVALISTPDNPLSLDASLNVRVLLFTALVAAATASIFGLVPAWRGTRVSPQTAMKANGRGVAEGHLRFTLSKSLVVAQVALSLTLLVGSALLIGTLRNLSTLDPGFSPRGVLLVSADFARAGLPPERVRGIRAEVLQNVRALPGVRAASTSDLTPISCCSWNDEVIVDGFTARSEMDAVVWFNRVSEGYFHTMETRLLAGRDFDATDVVTGPQTAIINESMAKKFFRSPTPLGRQFRTRMGDRISDPYTVIGVVEDAKYRNLRETNSETAYLAATQEKEPPAYVNLEVRSDDPTALVGSIKSTIAAVHRAATTEFTGLEAQVARSLQREHVLAVLSGLFGAVALALATLGLYGVMTYTVARRRNEIGVRIALGADRARVLTMVLSDVARVVLIGLVVGAVGALGSGRLVTSFLYGLAPADPAILVAAAGVLALVALAAGLAPALRASRVDPVAALRED